MNNISLMKDCYGCGVCAAACPKKVISIELNADGFYTPKVAEDGCTDCGLCLSVCACNDAQPLASHPRKSFAAWSRDKQVLRKCSSGGVGFEIGKLMLGKGYKVCGVRYDATHNRAEHYIASTPEALLASTGSKYIQSYTVDGFSAINRKGKYLVTGTPCQMDSFRRYIRKFKVEENFILMDFFCHSVPSMWAWKKYTEMVERKVGKIVDASWRNKQTGWHDSWAMAMDGELHGKKSCYNSRLSQGDLFYHLFLGDYCCNPACQNRCKYKYDQSASDIRIGDLWGKTYKENDEGVSALVAFTEVGEAVIQELEGCELTPHPFEIVAEGQMRKNAGKAQGADRMMKLLKSPKSNIVSIKAIVLCGRIKSLFKRIHNKLKF